jgi:GntP family gluconate:H+ symporter
MSLAELEEIATKPESELPGFWASLAPILLPVILITSNTVAATVAPGSPFFHVTEFVGDPSLALILSAAVSMWLLARHRRWSLKQLAKPVEAAIGSAGMIILITAGGGAFGGMLQAAGVGDALGEVARDFGIPLMAMAFFLAVLFKIAVGSATVCMITTASILAPLVVAAPPPYHPVYILMMIGAGSLVGVWMNDSGFWVFRTMTGLTEMETLQTKSALLVILGLTAIVVCVIMSRIFPLV